ncbi:hypothetical protein vseg_010020 [Gypsophila vaccaria]
MDLKVENPVFVETNLGTRFVISVSPHITSPNLQREIERAHNDIFPELGFLSVNALMGFGNFWPLHADVSLVKTLEKSSLLGKVVSAKTASIVRVHHGKEVNKKIADIRSKKHRRRRFWCLNTFILGGVATACLLSKKKRKTSHLKRRVPKHSFSDTLDPNNEGHNQQKAHDPEQVSDTLAVTETETPSESISEVMSVSGIISRYFADFIEVGHLGSALCSEASVRFGHKIREGQLRDNKQASLHKTGQILCSPLSKELTSVRSYERSEIGKRLVIASNSLSRCQNSHGSSLSEGKRVWGSDANSVVRNLVFDIDDDD